MKDVTNSFYENKVVLMLWEFLIVFSLFEYIFDYTIIPFAIKKIVFMGIFLGCVLCFIIKGNLKISHKQTLCVIFILFILLEIMIFSKDFLSMLIIACLPLLVVFKMTYKNVEHIQVILAVSGLIIGASCIIQFLFPSLFYSISNIFMNTKWSTLAHQFEGWNQYCGLTYQTGVAGIIIVTGIIAMITLPKKRYKIISILCFGILYTAIFLTGKRTLITISLLIPCIVYYFDNEINKKSKKMNRIVGIVFLSIICVILLQIASPYLEDVGIFSRLKNQQINENVDFLSGRKVLYESAWEMFEKHPIIGSGWGQFAKTSGHDTSVHNVYLQLLAETGMVGFVIFIALIFYTLKWTIEKIKSRKIMDIQQKQCYIFYLLLQLFFIIYCLTGNPLYGNSTRTLYIFACLMVLRTR